MNRIELGQRLCPSSSSSSSSAAAAAAATAPTSIAIAPLIARQPFTRLLIDLPQGARESAAVGAEHEHTHLLALAHHLLDRLDTSVGQLRDVDQT